MQLKEMTRDQLDTALFDIAPKEEWAVEETNSWNVTWRRAGCLFVVHWGWHVPRPWVFSTDTYCTGAEKLVADHLIAAAIAEKLETEVNFFELRPNAVN
jgi:hypothetical protein